MNIILDEETKDIIRNAADSLQSGSVGDFLNDVWDHTHYLYQFVDTVNYFTNDDDCDMNLFDDVDDNTPLYNLHYQWSIDRDHIFNPNIKNIRCKLNGPMKTISFPNLSKVWQACINQCPELEEVNFGHCEFAKFPFTINFVKDYLSSRDAKSLKVKVGAYSHELLKARARDTRNPIYTNFLNKVAIIYN